MQGGNVEPGRRALAAGGVSSPRSLERKLSAPLLPQIVDNPVNMKRILAAIATLAVLAGPAAASAKSPIEGRWKNGKMEVLIAPCGADLCGTVVRASAIQQQKAERGSDTDLIGARLVKDIEQTGPKTYRAVVFLADRNIYARGTITQLSNDQLHVRGCVLAIICKSRTWDRIR